MCQYVSAHVSTCKYMSVISHPVTQSSSGSVIQSTQCFCLCPSCLKIDWSLKSCSHSFFVLFKVRIKGRRWNINTWNTYKKDPFCSTVQSVSMSGFAAFRTEPLAFRSVTLVPSIAVSGSKNQCTFRPSFVD